MEHIRSEYAGCVGWVSKQKKIKYPRVLLRQNIEHLSLPEDDREAWNKINIP